MCNVMCRQGMYTNNDKRSGLECDDAGGTGDDGTQSCGGIK